MIKLFKVVALVSLPMALHAETPRMPEPPMAPPPKVWRPQVPDLATALAAFTGFAAKLDLPIVRPVTPEQVKESRDIVNSIAVTLTNGCEFEYGEGHVRYFFGRPPPADGKVRVTRDQAVAVARNVIKRLGYTEEMLYADLEPEVTLNEATSMETVETPPSYSVRWRKPNDPFLNSAAIAVDADQPRIHHLAFFNYSLSKPSRWLKLEDLPAVSPEHKAAAAVALIPKINAVIQKMGLPLPQAGPTNIDIELWNADDWGNVLVEKQHRFFFRGLRDADYVVNGYESTNAFFALGREVRVKDFIGEERITEKRALEIATAFFIHYFGETNINPPEIQRPVLPKSVKVPRLKIRLSAGKGPFGASGNIEVDLRTGAVKGFQYNISSP